MRLGRTVAKSVNLLYLSVTCSDQDVLKLKDCKAFSLVLFNRAKKDQSNQDTVVFQSEQPLEKLLESVREATLNMDTDYRRSVNWKGVNRTLTFVRTSSARVERSLIAHLHHITWH